MTCLCRLQWEGLPPPAVPVPRAVAAASEGVRTFTSETPAAPVAAGNAALPPSASNAATPLKHSALQSPEFISSSLKAKLPQHPNIDFGSPEHRPALPSNPTHPHCHSTPPHSSAKSSGFVTACAQRQCWACYLTSAIVSIICFCAAAIILLSSTTSNRGANSAASEESPRAAESSPQCQHFNGLQRSHRLSAFLQSPDGALLLFATSVFLAAVSRSSFTACVPLHQPLSSYHHNVCFCFPSSLCCCRWNALKAASTELELAFEEREQMLRTLQSSASAKVITDLKCVANFSWQHKSSVEIFF